MSVQTESASASLEQATMAPIHHLRRRITADDGNLPTNWEIAREQYAGRLQRLRRALCDIDDRCPRTLVGDVVYTAFMPAQLHQRGIHSIIDATQLQHNRRRVVEMGTNRTEFWRQQEDRQALNAGNETNVMALGTWKVTGSLHTSTMADTTEGMARVYGWQHATDEDRVHRLYSWDSPRNWDAEIYGDQDAASDKWWDDCESDDHAFDYNDQTQDDDACYGQTSHCDAAGLSTN